MRISTRKLKKYLIPVVRPVLLSVLAYAALTLVVWTIYQLTHPNVWIVTYYPTTNFTGTPSTLKKPLVFEFENGGSPAPGIGKNHYSSRWWSCMKLDQDTTVEFALSSDDGSRLFVDDQQLIEEWRPQRMTEKIKEVRLSKGTHLIRIEFYQVTSFAALLLKGRLKENPDSKAFEKSLSLPEENPLRCDL